MKVLTDEELERLEQKLKDNLSKVSGDTDLETQIDSVGKHVTAYRKIIYEHIEQLKKVLKLDNHNKTLETAQLADSIKQLIELFPMLKETDIQLLETLAQVTRNWQPSYDEQSDNTANALSETIVKEA